MTEPNEKGRRYQHGTLTAYNAARCHCQHCRAAYAEYRARRRAGGKDNPSTPKARDTDGHISDDWFRNQVWYPAREATGLSKVRIHDLRHAHASWLPAGGADLQVVKERLGHAIAVIAILASANALAHSYAGLYDRAIHHRLTGWQAMSWPAEIDVFLAVGELALYVAYLDAWPGRQRIWPWATPLAGLAVSVAGNVGHIRAIPGEPVTAADRLTAATSPLAAFAGLSVGLLVVKMTRQHITRPRPRPG